MVDGALGLGADTLGYNATFVYPRAGGIEALARALAAQLSGGEVRTSLAPVAIDWRARTAAFNDGSTGRFSGLVSTIPLPALVDLLAASEASVPLSVREAASRLRATDVTWVAVGVRGPNVLPWHWVYTPEPEFGTYRIGSPSAVFPGTVPPAPPSTWEYRCPARLLRCGRGGRPGEGADDPPPGRRFLADPGSFPTPTFSTIMPTARRGRR